MEIYIICTLFILISSIIEYKDKQLGRILFLCGIFLLFLISAIRSYNVGTDTKNYLQAYNFLNFNDLRSNVEVSWYALNWICKNVFNSYRAVLVIASFLTLLFIKKSICKISNNWNLSLYYFVVFYFYFQSFNIMRQILAAAIVLYAFTFIKEKKIFSYLLYIIIATTFHTTALVALPIYYICQIKVPKFISILLVILSFVFSFKLIPIILDYISNIELYEMYIHGDIKDSSYISKNLILHSCILLILTFDKNRNNMYYIFLVGILIVNILSYFEVMGRIGIYFKLAIILIIPNMSILISKTKVTKLAHVFIAIFMFISCIIMLQSNTEGVIPYSYL